MSNIERFKADLDRLLEFAGDVELALLTEAHGRAEVAKALGSKTGGVNRLDKLQSFALVYEEWFSESLAVVRQLLPDRLGDFRENFEIPKNRREITYATYRIQDALKGLRVTRPRWTQLSLTPRLQYLFSYNRLAF